MQLAIALIFIWTGFICSISFFESWIKFRAKGVTLPVALSIGKLVFTVLNKIEWGIAIGLAAILLVYNLKSVVIWSLLAAIGVLLVLQTLWLLPVLNARAMARIAGKQVPHSAAHLNFVAVELLKLLLLAATGYLALQTI